MQLNPHLSNASITSVAFVHPTDKSAALAIPRQSPPGSEAAGIRLQRASASEAKATRAMMPHFSLFRRHIVLRYAPAGL
jgi:hypothetical protein